MRTMRVLRRKWELRAQRYFARTTDGWKIALYRYRPEDGGLPGQSPVLLCHGLGANRYNMDAPKRSLARWLCRRGFDCWVIELRGAGRSERPGLLSGRRREWVFDDHVQHDVPAALQEIRKRTGADRVHWIGHSMGGMVAYAYMMTFGGDRLRSLCAVASPSFAHMGHPLVDKAARLAPLLKIMPSLRYSHLAWLLVPVMPVFKPTLGRLYGNPQNLSTLEMQALVPRVLTDLSPTLLRQFAAWYTHRGFVDAYQHIIYSRELHRITAPTLVVAGAADLLTPPKDLQHVYDSISSEDKKMLIVGRASGCRHDYGHIDLVLGRYADEEVFPHFADWFTSH